MGHTLGQARLLMLAAAHVLLMKLPLSLIYDDGIKPDLLNYLHATFLLSEADIDREFV